MSTTSTTSSKLYERLKPDSIIKNCYGENHETDSEPQFVLAYWSIRGLAAPIRALLMAAKVNHWIVMYDCLDGSDDGVWNKDSWWNDKSWLLHENPLINLPFLMDCRHNPPDTNCRVLCHTNAILTFLGRELNMLGNTRVEASRSEELLCQLMDLRDQMVRFAYGSSNSSKEGDKEDAQQLLTRVEAHWNKLENYLKRQYAVDEHVSANKKERRTICYLLDILSAPDFHLWELLDQFVGLCRHYQLSNCLDAYPCLNEFYSQFRQLPENVDYMTFSGAISSSHDESNNKDYSEKNRDKKKMVVVLPYNNPMARFGTDPQTQVYVRGQSETPWRNLGVQTNHYNI